MKLESVKRLKFAAPEIYELSGNQDDSEPRRGIIADAHLALVNGELIVASESGRAA